MTDSRQCAVRSPHDRHLWVTHYPSQTIESNGLARQVECSGVSSLIELATPAPSPPAEASRDPRPELDIVAFARLILGIELAPWQQLALHAYLASEPSRSQ